MSSTKFCRSSDTQLLGSCCTSAAILPRVELQHLCRAHDKLLLRCPAVAPQLLSLDLFKLLGGLLGGGGGGGGAAGGAGGVSVRILGLEVNLLNNRPLLGATKTGFLGLGRRRLQAASGRQARRLLSGNTWRPTCAFFLLRTPNRYCVGGPVGSRVEYQERGARTGLTARSMNKQFASALQPCSITWQS
jgi:hypothetical protein